MAAPRTSKAAATRARLLDAAVLAFAERGYHATTTRDIAAGAGMSPAALYVHHASKEELLYEIAKRGHMEVLEVIESAMDIRDPVLQLRLTVYAFVEAHLRGTTSARVINYELSALSEEHYAEVLAMRRQTESILRHMIDRGIHAGVFDIDDSGMPTLAILSLGIDIARWYHGGVPTVDEVASSYADMALRIVGARKTKRRTLRSEAVRRADAPTTELTPLQDR